MKKYLAIYKEFLATSLSEALSFRVNSILVVVMDLLFYAATIYSVEIIYQNLEMIGPWQKQEFLFFIAFMLTIDHIHMALISENFWNTSYLIRTGKLDFELLRPAGTLFTIFARHIRVQTLLLTPVPWAALIYYGLQVPLDPLAWLLVPVFVILGLTLLVSIEILITMLMFYTIESFGINFLRMQFQQLARWPDFIYHWTARIFFSFALPILLIGSAPVQFLLDFSHYKKVLFMIGAILVIWPLIGWSWRAALRNYESASS